ncbi:hypothetical protein DY000_02023852 [Brassica cretica]|uniref:Uncharacterized protein n=1 Tax=Brassica cretica TaxID=69181 RepID=A0ABQ7E172_BRACR|nr:hypothetical protein DY000_02023852 [Brassica cretica]
MFFRSGFGYAGFSYLENFWTRRLPDDFEEDFQTTSRKSSRRLPGSLPDDFQEVFNQMVLIFHLNIFFRSGFDKHVFRSGSDFGTPMGSHLGSLLKYNAIEDFQEVFHTTSKKSSSRRLHGSLPGDFKEVF